MLLALLNSRRTDYRTLMLYIKPFGASAAPAVPRLLELLPTHATDDLSVILELLEAIGPSSASSAPPGRAPSTSPRCCPPGARSR